MDTLDALFRWDIRTCHQTLHIHLLKTNTFTYKYNSWSNTGVLVNLWITIFASLFVPSIPIDYIADSILCFCDHRYMLSNDSVFGTPSVFFSFLHQGMKERLITMISLVWFCNYTPNRMHICKIDTILRFACIASTLPSMWAVTVTFNEATFYI